MDSFESWKLNITNSLIDDQVIFLNESIEFWDIEKIKNEDNYYSLIIGKNWVWKTTFLKYLINDFIKSNSNKKYQLMFTTHSVFDDFPRSDINANYIYNWIKWRNNSANAKSIYNLNKKKIFTLLESWKSQICDTLKYIYNLNKLTTDNLFVNFNFLGSLKEELSHDVEWLWKVWINKCYDLMDEIDINEWVWFNNVWYDILDEIKEAFNNKNYNFNVDAIPNKLLLAIYVFVTILDKIEIENKWKFNFEALNILDFFKFKSLFEEKLNEYTVKYNNLIDKEYNTKFNLFIKENNIYWSNLENFKNKTFKFLKKEIKFSELKKINNFDSLGLKEQSFIRYFDSFYTDTFKNTKDLQSVLDLNFYDFLNEISRIREKNWWQEAFTYDIWYLSEKSDFIKNFWKSSSWELVLLYTYLHLTDFSKNKSVKKIFIIDEPEISLHPQWQKDYIGNLNELLNKLNLDNVFTIIVTHSPLILLWSQERYYNRENDEFEKEYNADIFWFIDDWEKTISTPINYISMNSIDEVLWDDFWVDLFSESYKNNIEKRYKELLKIK